jgi:flagellar assembly factor FliW
MTTSVPSAPAPSPMSVRSQALGPVEIDPALTIRLLEPLAGFAGCTRYALVPHLPGAHAGESIQWLHALDDPFHVFVVTEPWTAFPDYAPELPDADARELGLGSHEDARLFVILTVAGSAGGITANLRAPIVVNAGARVAKQVVLLGDAYQTRHALRGGR